VRSGQHHWFGRDGFTEDGPAYPLVRGKTGSRRYPLDKSATGDDAGLHVICIFSAHRSSWMQFV
jgi:hypothetical protein